MSAETFSQRETKSSTASARSKGMSEVTMSARSLCLHPHQSEAEVLDHRVARRHELDAFRRCVIEQRFPRTD